MSPSLAGPPMEKETAKMSHKSL